MMRQTVILFLSFFVATTYGKACNVCGKGFSVSKPDSKVGLKVLALVGLGNVGTCGQLQFAGDSGVIPNLVCPTLPYLRAIRKNCGCEKVTAAAPAAAPAATPAAAPVSAPASAPAAAPAPVPVPVPVKVPTPVKGMDGMMSRQRR